jgi:GR25 family glycosyltransferase involved in LPS biosynthesis
LGYEYTLVEGLSGASAPSAFSAKFAGRHKGSTRDASIGALYSHYRVWQQIVVSGSPGIVLEDDAVLVRDFDETLLGPCEGIVLLGGVLRTSGAWAREKEEFLDSSEYLRIHRALKPGINPMPTKKFTMAIAYYVPHAVAKTLIARADNSSHLKVIDAFLSMSGLVGGVFYPNPFRESPDSKSQCGSPAGDLHADLYLSTKMRKHALKHNLWLKDFNKNIYIYIVLVLFSFLLLL